MNVNKLAAVIAGLLGSSLALADITDVGDTTSLGVGVTTRTPDEPMGIQEGDFRLGVCSTTAVTDGTWSATGWEKLTEVAATNGTARDVAIFYSFRGSSAGNLTFSYSGSSATARCSMQVFRGVDPDVPFDVVYVQADHFSDNNNGANVAHEPITTVTDGAWVVLVQVRSGDTATGSAAPSGYTMVMDYIGNNPEMNIAYKAMPSAGLDTPGTWGHTGVDFAESANFTLALRPYVAPPPNPEFVSVPAIDTEDEGGVIFTYQSDAAGDTLYGMLTHPAASTPTCAAIAAGTGSRGDANETTTGAADSIFIGVTDPDPFWKYSAHFCLVDGDGNESSVETVTGIELPPPDGFQWVQLSSVGTGSPCDVFNAATSPDITGDDYLRVPLETTPGGDEITVGDDCHLMYPGDGSRQEALIDVHDWSEEAWHADQIWFVDHNAVPTCSYSGEPALVFPLLTEITADFGGVCDDPIDNDALTFSATGLPDGCTLNASTALLTCEATTEDLAGTTVEVRAADYIGDYGSFEFTAYVVGTVTMPNVVGLELEAEMGALDTILDAMPWRALGSITVTEVCAMDAMDGEVIEQSPEASESMGVTDPISLTVASSDLCQTGGPRRRMVLLGG